VTRPAQVSDLALVAEPALRRPFKYAAALATAREKVLEINTIVAGRRAVTQVSAVEDGSQPSRRSDDARKHGRAAARQ
jgi:hypothetical protein